MNIFAYEIKSSLKSALIWAIALVAVLAALMLGAYPSYSDAKDQILSLLSNYPPEFLAAFGMKSNTLFSYGGFYSFAFAYLGLMGAIMASSVSISVFSREKRFKCTDFLLTKPVSRPFVFFAKFFAVLLVILAVSAVYIAAGIIFYKSAADDSVTLQRYFIALTGFFFNQLFFVGLGVFYATFAKKVRSVSAAANAIGFAAFITSALAALLEDAKLEYLAPPKYFEPLTVIETGLFDTGLVAAAALIFVLCVGLSFYRYCKSDTVAV